MAFVGDAADFIAEQKPGADALDRRFNLSAFKNAVRGFKRDVKSGLMDQQIIAGVRNIYLDEILFQARINTRRADIAKRILAITGGGVDHVLEITGDALFVSAWSRSPQSRRPHGTADR